MNKTLRDISVGPIHPGRGKPSYIELRAIPGWLKGDYYVTAQLSQAEAVRLIEQLSNAIMSTTLPMSTLPDGAR